MQNAGTIYTVKDAEKASKPMSFMIFYASDSLPEILVIDDTLLQNALKSRNSYSVTTVAVTKSNVSSGLCERNMHGYRQPLSKSISPNPGRLMEKTQLTCCCLQATLLQLSLSVNY